MLRRLADTIASGFVKRQVILEDSKSTYVYGLELLLSSIFSSGCIVIIGILIHRTVDVLFFLAIFSVLRSFTGGYHARTFSKCTIVTLTTFGLVMALSKLLSVNIPVYVITVIAVFFIILVLAPIENPNKRIPASKKKLFKAISVALLLLFSGSGIVFAGFSNGYGDTIFFSILADTVLLFPKAYGKEDASND